MLARRSSSSDKANPGRETPSGTSVGRAKPDLTFERTRDMAAIGKRFLNVLTLLSTAYLLSVLYVMLTGVSDWYVFIFFNGGALVLCYGAVATLNYIFFGAFTLWHRNPSGRAG